VTQPQGADYARLSFTARRFQLAQLAEWVLPAVPSATTLPVNGCFCVTTAPERLSLAGSGAAVSIFASSEAVTGQGEGTVYIPAKKFRAMLAEAPEGDVTVTVKGNEAHVTAGSASWSLRLPPPDGYTGLPAVPGEFAPVGREPLLAALTTVRHAMGKDAGRPSLHQVSIMEFDGAMYACAVDSSQLSRAPVPGFPLPVCVPGGALDDLVKLLGKSAADTVEVADSGSHVVFRAGPVTLAAARTTAPFPDVSSQLLQQVTGNDQALRVDKAELTRALRRVRVNADSHTSAVALIVDSDNGRGSLTVTSRDAGGNSAEEVIAARWSGGRQLLVVNAGFLEAMLTVHPAAECEFRIGKDRGRVKFPLLLEDAGAKVLGICPQLVASMMGY